MSRQNKLGTSYCSLGLDGAEETELQKFLKAKGWSCKSYIRMLIRKDLNIQIQLKAYEK